MGEAAMLSQLPSGSGSSIPSHASRVEPLRPAWPSCSPIFAWLWAWTKSTIRFHAGTCSDLYMPVHPGEIRPSRETSVISVKTRPAPPMARAPRWTRCQSLGVPSTAQYWHIGDTTTRFTNSRSRNRKGVNRGDGVLHGELRARSHGEVGSVRGVAQQHDLLVMPPLVPQRAEVAPQGAVLEEPMPLQLRCEQRFAERERRVLIGAVHPRRLPSRFRGFDDERRASPFVLVGVDPPQAVAIALEVERERGEGAVGTEPHVAVVAPIHGRVDPG